MNHKHSGWIVLDKPEGISSHEALIGIKKFFKPSKVGHAGTLDPFASGMLLVGVGEATKLQDYVMASSKEYEFTIKFGTATNTYDSTGEVIANSNSLPNVKQLEEAIKSFVGGYLQMPPIYSAKKVAGVKACDAARSGKEIKLTPCNVKLYDVSLVDYHNDEASIICSVGAGFYIRSFTVDICNKLAVCGHVNKLRRTKIGKFNQGDMISLASLKELMHNSMDSEGACILRPIDNVLDDILVHKVDAATAIALKHGKNPSINKPDLDLVIVKSEDVLIAICNVKDGQLYPKRVFNL